MGTAPGASTVRDFRPPTRWSFRPILANRRRRPRNVAFLWRTCCRCFMRACSSNSSKRANGRRAVRLKTETERQGSCAPCCAVNESSAESSGHQRFGAGLGEGSGSFRIVWGFIRQMRLFFLGAIRFPLTPACNRSDGATTCGANRSWPIGASRHPAPCVSLRNANYFQRRGVTCTRDGILGMVQTRVA
jgi:hypothetical protein